MDLLEQPVEDAFLGEDQLPRINLDQIARPQRQHDAEIEQRLPFAPGVARRDIGDGEGDDGRGDSDVGSHRNGADDDVEVLRLQQFAIGLERELMDDDAGKIVEREEALQQQRQQRAEIDDAEPEHGRGQQQEDQEPRALPEIIRQAAEPAAAVGEDRSTGGGGAHASSSIRCSASLEKPMVTWSPSTGTSSAGGMVAWSSMPLRLMARRIVAPR